MEKLSLKNFIQESRFNEEKAMNLLQLHGIISDNAVTVEDVADQADAIRFLSRYLPKKSACQKPVSVA